MKSLFAKSAIFLTVVLLFLSVPASLSVKAKFAAAQAPNINAWGDFASGKVKRGRSVQASVTIDIPGGYHTHSNKPFDKYLIPTKLEVSAPSGVRVGPVFYPPGKIVNLSFSKNKLSVYEGKTTMKFNVTVPSNYSGGQLEVKAKVKYQSCNDSECYAPTSKDVYLKIDVE